MKRVDKAERAANGAIELGEETTTALHSVEESSGIEALPIVDLSITPRRGTRTAEVELRITPLTHSAALALCMWLGAPEYLTALEPGDLSDASLFVIPPEITQWFRNDKWNLETAQLITIETLFHADQAIREIRHRASDRLMEVNPLNLERDDLARWAHAMTWRLSPIASDADVSWTTTPTKIRDFLSAMREPGADKELARAAEKIAAAIDADYPNYRQFMRE